MPRSKQTSFVGGVLAPALYGRNDLQKYPLALACAYNTILRPEGPVVNRAGLRFSQQAKQSSTKGARLIPFQFNTEQQYVLEFQDLAMRVIRNGSYVYNSPSSISGATQANPVVITTGAAHGVSNGDEVFIENVLGMTELNQRSFIAANVTATTMELTDLEGANVNGTSYTAYTAGGSVESVYELVTPYAIGDLYHDPDDPLKPGLKYVQSADTMTLTHIDYETRELTRTDHNAWTIALKSFEPELDGPTGISVTPAGTGALHEYKVTSIDDETGEESLPGRSTQTAIITAITQANPCVVTVSSMYASAASGDEIEIDGIVGMTELNDRRFTVDAVSGSDLTLRGIDSTTFTAYASGGTVHSTKYARSNNGLTSNRTVSWTEVAGAGSYNVYKRIGAAYGLVGNSRTASLVDRTQSDPGPDYTAGPPTFRDPFADEDTYPQTTTYFDQRLWFGGSKNLPQNLYASQSSAFNNFAFSSPFKDSDAITRRLNSTQVNEIRHLVPMFDLIVMTSAAEVVVAAGQDEVVTPTSIIAKPQTQHGSAHVRPFVIDNSALYVDKTGQVIRDFGFQPNNEGEIKYSSNDRSVLVRHIFDANDGRPKRKVLDMAFTGAPDSIVWVVLDDGKMASMTYVPSQDVWGWCEHETRGDVESVAHIEESDGPTTYFLVKRTVNGTTKRFIEYMKRRDYEDDEDALFVDSSLTLDSPFTITGYTTTDPVVVTTSAAHGLSNGDTVDIDNVRATPDPDASDATIDDEDLSPYLYDAINKNGWKVANVTATTFELQDSDSVDVDGTSWREWGSGGEVRKAVTTVTGLHHLAGATVVGLGNGDAVAGLTVSAAGEVTLQDAASRVHLGLGYYSEIETLDMDLQDAQGDVDSRKKHVAQMFIRVNRTRGIQAGQTRSKLFPVKPLLGAIASGVVAHTMRGRWDRAGRTVIRQDLPLPMEVSGISAKPDLGDDD